MLVGVVLLRFLYCFVDLPGEIDFSKFAAFTQGAVVHQAFMQCQRMIGKAVVQQQRKLRKLCQSARQKAAGDRLGHLRPRKPTAQHIAVYAAHRADQKALLFRLDQPIEDLLPDLDQSRALVLCKGKHGRFLSGLRQEIIRQIDPMAVTHRRPACAVIHQNIGGKGMCNIRKKWFCFYHISHLKYRIPQGI